MSCLVYHDKNPTFGILFFCAGDPIGTDRVWPDDFDLVAEVQANTPEQAFALTNHVDENWTKNPEIKHLMIPSPRSSSPGDIIVTNDGKVHYCRPVGWIVLAENNWTEQEKITINLERLENDTHRTSTSAT